MAKNTDNLHAELDFNGFNLILKTK
jgi:hypothetical protein